MLTVIDVENAFQVTERGELDGSAFNALNFLVSVGWRTETGTQYKCVRHNDEPSDFDPKELQYDLNQTTLLVGHNLKWDLTWLRECGFVYDGAVADTMLIEYLFLRSVKLPLDLSSCCTRYGLPTKVDEVKKMMNKGISCEKIPWLLLKEYGIQDVDITWDLFHAQLATMEDTKWTDLIY